MALAEPFVHRMRIRYAECDAQGVVFNAHYLAYVDDTISAMWRAAFGGYQVMLDRRVDIVVAQAQLRFLDAGRFDEEIEIETRVTHLGTTSMRTVYRFLREGELLLTATLRHVFVELGTSTKTPIPDWVRVGLEQWLLPDLDVAPASARAGAERAGAERAGAERAGAERAGAERARSRPEPQPDL